MRKAINTIPYLIILGIVLSCSNDEVSPTAVQIEGFEFTIKGDIEKTIRGPVAYFAHSTEQDIFGEDLNTISFSAVDQGNGQVSFGITTYDLITKGTYPIELRIAPEAYNGFINFIENPPDSPIFGPIGGSIRLLEVKENEVSGILDVSCQDMVSGDTITIKGNFTAIRQ